MNEKSPLPDSVSPLGNAMSPPDIPLPKDAFVVLVDAARCRIMSITLDRSRSTSRPCGSISFLLLSVGVFLTFLSLVVTYLVNEAQNGNNGSRKYNVGHGPQVL